MAKYECKICGYEFDEQQAGESFDNLYSCPICDAAKEMFIMTEGEEEKQETEGNDDDNENGADDEFKFEEAAENVSTKDKEDYNIFGVGEESDNDASDLLSDDEAKETSKKTDDEFNVFAEQSDSVKENETSNETSEDEKAEDKVIGENEDTILNENVEEEVKENIPEESKDEEPFESIFRPAEKFEDKEEKTNKEEEDKKLYEAIFGKPYEENDASEEKKEEDTVNSDTDASNEPEVKDFIDELLSDGDKNEENKGFVIEKRQEFWKKEDENVEHKEEKKEDAPFTVSHVGSVFKVIGADTEYEERSETSNSGSQPSNGIIQTFYTGNPVKSEEEAKAEEANKNKENSQEFKPFFGSGMGTIQRVLGAPQTNADSEEEFVFEDDEDNTEENGNVTEENTVDEDIVANESTDETETTFENEEVASEEAVSENEEVDSEESLFVNEETASEEVASENEEVVSDENVSENEGVISEENVFEDTTGNDGEEKSEQKDIDFTESVEVQNEEAPEEETEEFSSVEPQDYDNVTADTTEEEEVFEENVSENNETVDEDFAFAAKENEIEVSEEVFDELAEAVGEEQETDNGYDNVFAKTAEEEEISQENEVTDEENDLAEEAETIADEENDLVEETEVITEEADESLNDDFEDEDDDFFFEEADEDFEEETKENTDTFEDVDEENNEGSDENAEETVDEDEGVVFLNFGEEPAKEYIVEDDVDVEDEGEMINFDEALNEEQQVEEEIQEVQTESNENVSDDETKELTFDDNDETEDDAEYIDLGQIYEEEKSEKEDIGDSIEEIEETQVAYSMLKSDMKYTVLYDNEAKKIFEDYPVSNENVSNGLENIILLPAQCNPLPLDRRANVDTKTVIGALTACPVEVSQPFCFSKLFIWGEHIPNNSRPEEYTNQALVLVKGEEGHIPNLSSKEELKEEVAIAKARFHGTPVGLDLVAGRIEADLEACVYAKVDFVILNDVSSRILPYALRRARNYLNRVNSKLEILVCVDALKDAQELAKILALGANFVLVERGFDLEMANDMTESLKEICRSTGHSNVHDLNLEDICTIDTDLAMFTDISHV